jgi:hypothetical protein
MQGEGTGVIELNDGKVTGGDTVLAYTGSYAADGDKFTAFIATKRHSPGQPSVFGIDEVNLTLTGKLTPRANKPGRRPISQNEGPELVYGPYVELGDWPARNLRGRLASPGRRCPGCHPIG